MECDFHISSICLCSRIRDNNLIIMRAHYTRMKEHDKKKKNTITSTPKRRKKKWKKQNKDIWPTCNFQITVSTKKVFFLFVKPILLDLHSCAYKWYVYPTPKPFYEWTRNQNAWSKLRKWYDGLTLNSKIRQIVLSLHF